MKFRPKKDGDHPRSRGVYRRRHATTRSLRGSSPLARGLLRLAEDAGDVVRIIPARAGFTPPLRRRRRRRRDHPRSRGVYVLALRQYLPCRGSSPLARGLPFLDGFRGVEDRIIPARAGFTGVSPTGTYRWEDHPRSRGVYLDKRLTSSCTEGSSPLARGLLPAPAPPTGRPGIIPARAGFTLRRRGLPLLGRDHPRSRGVY